MSGSDLGYLSELSVLNSIGSDTLARIARSIWESLDFRNAERPLSMRAMRSCDQLRGVDFESRSCRVVPDVQGDQGLSLIKNPNLVYEPWWLSTIDSIVGPAKYIICLRDPLTALNSFYWYRRRELDQQSSWINPRRRPAVVPSEKEVMQGQAELLGASRSRISYPKWIKPLLNFIPPNRLLCLCLERFSADPVEGQRTINAFLGYQTNVSDNYSVHNRNHHKPSQNASESIIKYDNDGFFANVKQETRELLLTTWGRDSMVWEP